MREEKEKYVDHIGKRFKESGCVIVSDYKGMNVDEFSILRGKLSEDDSGKLTVIKNTYARLAAAKAGLPKDFSKKLSGQTAYLMCEDALKATKTLSQFQKDNKKAKFVVGVVDGDLISEDDFKTLANLPSIEILQTQLLGLMQQSASLLVRVLNEPAAALARVLQAKSEQS